MSSTRETDSLPSFGRRNNDDSSSSRESSPVRKHKRSFTPTSDDEVLISFPDNDDTPPPEGPLIRQAVAFSWTPSIATAPASINTYQAPSISVQNHNTAFLPGQEVTAPPKPPKTRKKKRKAEDDPSASQQTRFRLASYDSTPSTMPALTKGSGPYESMYRATSAKVDAEAPPEMANKTKFLNSQPKASTSKTKVAPSKAKSSTSKQTVAPLPPSNMPSVAAPAPRDVAAHTHYRRDYDVTGEGTPQPRAPKRHAPQRLVTILIEDLRGENPDPQLVEVRVPLRESDNADDGFWAYAQDICQNLQGSPSRIDGPAKVYTMRGRFRQLILKVTADNTDQFVHANVVVNPERTLQVVIETGLPPGALPSHAAPFSSPQRAASFAGDSPSSSRKRRRSPSASEMHYDNSRRWSPATMRSSPPESLSRGRPSPAVAAIPLQDTEESSSSETSSEEEDEDTIHKHISDEVDAIIQQESNWTDYFKLSAKPRTAAVLVAEYGVVQSFVDKYVGTSVPSGAVIEASHIARALRMEKEPVKYMAECRETVHLLGLYGPAGERLQHPEVIEKAKDDTLPAYNANPAKALLRFMRQVDAQWNATHPASE